MVNRGILYIATGESYIQEAQRSAKRAANITELPVSIVAHRDIDSELFDEVIIDETPSDTFADKPQNLLKSPYDETLYMDTDTYIVDSIPEIFACLKYSPLAVTIDPFEGALYDEEIEVNGSTPKSFPEFQTGIIVYRQSDSVTNFIDCWNQNHYPASYPDQLSFRQTLYNHNINVSPLPLRYNTLIGTAVNGPVMILHDNNRFLKSLTEKELGGFLDGLNESTWLRILYNPDFNHVPCNPIAKFIPFQIGVALMRHGYTGLLKETVHHLKNRFV